MPIPPFMIPLRIRLLRSYAEEAHTTANADLAARCIKAAEALFDRPYSAADLPLIIDHLTELEKELSE